MDENKRESSPLQILIPSVSRYRRNTTSWLPGGALSFRNKSRKLFGRYGTNLQNIPDKLRRIYVSPPGYSFVQADEKGAEALIVAFLGPAGIYRELFRFGINVHSHLALHLFQKYWQDNTPYDAGHLASLSIPDLSINPSWKELSKIIKESDGWESKKRFYYFGKKTGHAHNYDMQAPTMSLDILKESGGEVYLSVKQANEFLQKRSGILPEVKEYHERVRILVKTTRCIRNLFGYPRDFYGPFSDKLFKEAFAQCPQSTVGTIANNAFAEEQNYIEEHNLDWTLLNNCHDSTLTQCPDSETMICGLYKKSIFEVELTSWDGEKFRMGAEISVGKNWGKYHKDENPDGMRELKI